MSLTNFETITPDLTATDFNLLDPLIEVLRTTTKNNPLNNSGIRFYLLTRTKVKMISDVKLRKLINHIRSESILPVIGTKAGYYISFEKSDIESAISSQMERIRQQQRAVDGLKKFLK